MLHLLLTKRNPTIFSVLTVFTSQLYSRPRNHNLLSHYFSASATQDPHLKPHDFNMVDYLTASFSVSHDRALRISKTIDHLKTSQKPDSVRRFFRHHGFSEDEVKTLVTLRPTLLCASVENTLEPNLRALRDIGLSSSTLTHLILSNPGALLTLSSVPGINFWRDFFGGDESALIKIFKNNMNLACCDLCRNIAPKMSLFKSHGMSTYDIQRILLHVSRLFNRRVSLLDDALKRAKELGFQPQSGMFVKGFSAMLRVSREVLQKKMELLKTYGWSEDEFLAALGKSPVWIEFSEKTLKAKMDFLVGEAMCEPSYIASIPVILSYSLQKRLRPRHHVLHLLETKGLRGERKGIFHIICMPESKFAEIYILPHKNEIPTLHEAYLTASASGTRLNISAT